MSSSLCTCYPLYHFISCVTTSDIYYTVLNYYQHLYHNHHMAILLRYLLPFPTNHNLGFIASRSHRREWALLSFQSVCLSVGHSTTYSLPWLINHNHIWSAGIYLSSDPCKPFWIPCLPYFGCQRKKYAKFRLFPTRILATANVTHCAIWLVHIYSHASILHEILPLTEPFN